MQYHFQSWKIGKSAYLRYDRPVTTKIAVRNTSVGLAPPRPN